MGKLRRYLNHLFIEHVELRVDGTRALRAMIAFAVPLTVCHWLHRPAEAMFISTAAMNLSLPDLRGAYRVRVGILGAMILIATGSALVGGVFAASPVGAALAMGGVAVLGGLWRHLSADYGPSMAVSSALLFLLGLSQPGGPATGWHLAALTALGGGFAGLLHTCSWLFRPQHALRYSVAETWVAAADLVAAMRPEPNPDKTSRCQAVARLEGGLRDALDRTFLILGAAEDRKQAAFIAHLEAVRREVVHFTMRVIALNTSLESILEQPAFARCLPVVDSVLKTLSDAARSSAITLIMHRAENFAATEVRLRRCHHLIKILEEQIAAVSAVAADAAAAAQVRNTLAEVARELPRIQDVLRKTSDYAVLLRFYSAGLPDLSARSVQSLGAWIRPSARTDPVLLRHGLRMAALTMLAVAIYKGFAVPRGYWIAFTIVVVLQPDYGSTRQRAGQRLVGTAGGILLASGLLWLHPSVFVLDTVATLAALIFAYYLKQSYGWAIFFVTINLVLVTETLSAVAGDFMVERVLSTLLGGALALLAARIFWPAWEREKFPVLLASAIRANRTFLLSMSGWLGLPTTGVTELLMARRRAENANRIVAASLERLLGEPAGFQNHPERAAALATYNQRVTRALTVLAVQLPAAHQLPAAPVSAVAAHLGAGLENMARVVEQGIVESAATRLAADLASLDGELAGLQNSTANEAGWLTSLAGLTWVQLSKITAEIRAMTLALNMKSPNEL